MSETASAAEQTRRGVGLFALERGLIRVSGHDRVRWLNGMISGDVAALAPGPTRSGCYALLLTPKGSIIADLHVLCDEEAFALELEADASADVLARLERYVISEDVTLTDISEEVARFALEGPRTLDLLEQLGVHQVSTLRENAWLSARIGDVEVELAAWGLSGERAYQLFAPRGEAIPLAARLAAAAAELAIPFARAGEEALELLRIEAGVPRLGAELDEDVLPAEAGLIERAVCFTKGCYTGQEIVARLESRGQVNHLLVGLRFESGEQLPEPGTPLRDPDGSDKPVGEVTSACVSPHCGAIGLGYVRRVRAEPGTGLSCGGVHAEVAALPFLSVPADERGAC